MKRRIVAVLCALMVLLCLTSCRKDEKQPVSEPSQSSVEELPKVYIDTGDVMVPFS